MSQDKDTDRASPQTPAQWAVRWHGVVLAALLVGAVPVYHLYRHVVLGHDEPLITTRSQQPVPPITRDAVVDGSWMAALDLHLREASPIVWALRGAWNEALFRLGVVQSPIVALGADDWLFLRATLRPDIWRFGRESAARRQFFARLRDQVRAAGAELVVSLVPDKARIYPEFAYPDGAIDPTKQPIYGRALEELRAEGIATVDVATMLFAARAAAPDQRFYYARDSHWRPEGALAAAQAIAAAIEALPLKSPLSPRRVAELGARSTFVGLGDLVGTLGLLTREVPVAVGSDRKRTQPLSLLTADLAEPRDTYAVVLRAEGGNVPPLVQDLDAEILLIGTSFSEADGAGALALALGRPIRAVIDFGASGLAGLQKVGDELRAGTRAKVVVFEIVERGLLEVDWATARY